MSMSNEFITKSPRRMKVLKWIAFPVVTVVLVVAVAAAAAVALNLFAATSVTARASPIEFQQGDDYAAIASAGYASLSTTDGGARAAISISGIPGAASLSLTNLVNISNVDANGKAYNVTLSRGAALPAAVTSLTVTVRDASGTLTSFNLATTATSGTFRLANGNEATIDVSIILASGTSVGAIGDFNLVALATPG